MHPLGIQKSSESVFLLVTLHQVAGLPCVIFKEHTGAIQLIALSVHLRSCTHTAGRLAATGPNQCRPAAEALGWF